MNIISYFNFEGELVLRLEGPMGPDGARAMLKVLTLTSGPMAGIDREKFVVEEFVSADGHKDVHKLTWRKPLTQNSEGYWYH